MKVPLTVERSTWRSDLGGLWAIAWRLFAYLPVMIVVGFSWLFVGLGLVTLPFVVAVSAYARSWEWAFGSTAIWFVFFALWRVLRLGGLWEAPPSVL